MSSCCFFFAKFIYPLGTEKLILLVVRKKLYILEKFPEVSVLKLSVRQVDHFLSMSCLRMAEMLCRNFAFVFELQLCEKKIVRFTAMSILMLSGVNGSYFAFVILLNDSFTAFV